MPNAPSVASPLMFVVGTSRWCRGVTISAPTDLVRGGDQTTNEQAMHAIDKKFRWPEHLTSPDHEQSIRCWWTARSTRSRPTTSCSTAIARHKREIIQGHRRVSVLRSLRIMFRRVSRLAVVVERTETRFGPRPDSLTTNGSSPAADRKLGVAIAAARNLQVLDDALKQLGFAPHGEERVFGRLEP